MRGMKVNSARELAELARKKPGAITIGITGRGAMSDLALQLFEADAGIQLQSVPYRGAAQAITDVLGGRLDGLVGDIPTVMGQVQAGKLKALATSSKHRSDIFPDVPTFVEQGFAGVIGDNWAGVLAPAGTPAPVIAKFNAAMVAALKVRESSRAIARRRHYAGAELATAIRRLYARRDRALAHGDPRQGAYGGVAALKPRARA